MKLDRAKLRAVQDGGVLHRLDNGIEIIRRIKHEPIEMEGLSKEELASRTNKVNGSKFLPSFDLCRVVEITVNVLQDNGATVGANCRYEKCFGSPIGISNGKSVDSLCVELMGRYAHAFPHEMRARKC